MKGRRGKIKKKKIQTVVLCVCVCVFERECVRVCVRVLQVLLLCAAGR